MISRLLAILDRLVATAIACVALWLLSFAAVAQDAASTKIDLMPTLLSLLTPAVGIILIAAVSWALRKSFGITLAARDVATVNDVLQKGLAYATAQLGTLPLTVDVKSEVIATAARYALTHGPDALKRVGISPEQLAEKLVARYMDPTEPIGVTAPLPLAVPAG